eukprot:Skav204860  [mRNA]  locus=scaffold1883:198033:203581:+ [translate_table: standard]
MPLSQEHLQKLKLPTTQIEFQTTNPKKIGSKAHERYEKYKAATSIGEAHANGAKWDDLTTDFDKAYLKFRDVEDSAMSSAPKRAAPEGTPGREAEARAKQQLTGVAPRTLEKTLGGSAADVAPKGVETNKIEMNPATIQALRMMMREEITNGFAEVEGRLLQTMADTMDTLKTQLRAETAAREQLEARVVDLERKRFVATTQAQVEEEVDKSIAVIGGIFIVMFV